MKNLSEKELKEDEKEAIKKQIKGFMEEADFIYEIYLMEDKYD